MLLPEPARVTSANRCRSLPTSLWSLRAPDAVAILTLLAAVYFGVLAHEDAHRVAAPAAQVTPVRRSSQLTDEDLKKIAAQVEADLRAAARSSHPPPKSQSTRERTDITGGTNQP
jgi:hypothetical protein